MTKRCEIVMVAITGPDRPGLLTELSSVLARFEVTILDIGQAVIHDDLSLGMLIELPGTLDAAQVLKELLVPASGLSVRMTPIPVEQYREWVGQQGRDRHILTLLASSLEATHLASVTEMLARQGLSIDVISRLSGRLDLDHPQVDAKTVVEFSVRGTPRDSQQLTRDFLDLSHRTGVDLAFQVDNIYRRSRRLVCFDMDSTLIQAEVIDELARRAGVYDKVGAITEAAMRGELDFKQSFVERLALLRGLPESVLQEVAHSLPLTDGAEKLLSTLKKYGYTTAILSGGFTYFGHFLQQRLGVDYVFANELEIEDGALTGRHVGEIIDGPRKAQLLKQLAEKEGIHLEQVIAVGDGANDLPMLHVAGLGIAFHAKPLVKQSARHALSSFGLDAILYLLGFRDSEL